MNPQVKKWREAHPGIDLPEAGLETMAPFPSLFANDFVAYLSSRENGAEIVTFVRDLTRELAWAYDLVAKMQRDSDLPRVFAGMIEASAYPAEYQLTNRFIRDYAKAHGIQLPQEVSDAPAWHGVFLEGGEIKAPNA